MTPAEITNLRAAVNSGKEGGTFVFWRDPNGEWRRVKSVPVKPLDPDGTGHPEIIAMLASGGHLDLDNCGTDEFWISSPLFADVAQPQAATEGGEHG